MNIEQTSRLLGLSAHRVQHGENSQLYLSENTVPITPSLQDTLVSNLIMPMLDRDEDFQFTFSNDDHKLNSLFQLASSVFDGDEEFHQTGQSIIKHLFQCSSHPNIKSGDVILMYIEDIPYYDELVSGIGIFKSESLEQYITFDQGEQQININIELGIALNKLDKTALILNTEKDEGYVIKMRDRTNGNQEVQYWEQDFLNVKTKENAYHTTTKYLNLAESYLKHQINQEFDIEPLHQKVLLKESVEFFNENPSFTQEEYKSQVLQNADVMESFDSFSAGYQRELGVKFEDQITVSPKAVKKNQKYFKSVLKLDKNFHIYIHGDHSLIERGTDPDGRKYYKVYYEEER